MRRIDRYFFSELIIPSSVGFLIMLMLLIGNQLYGLLSLLYSSNASGREIALMLLYYLPSVLMLAVPASLLLGTALALNRLERDREIQALRMIGLKLTRLVAPMVLLGLLFSVGMFIFQEKVIPFTSHQAETIKRKLIYGSPTSFIPEDLVFKLPDNSHVYIRHADPKTQTLYGVVVWKQDPGKFPTLITIPVAENRNGQWFLEPDPATGAAPRLYTFNEHGELAPYIDVTGPDSWMNMSKDVWAYMSDQPTTAEELTFRQLLQLKNGVRGTGMNMGLALNLDPKLLTFLLHRKFAYALAALVAVLIAIPLSVHFGRSGGYIGLLLSVVVSFFFVVSQQWAQVLVEQTHHMSPILGAWAPDALFGLMGIVLLVVEEFGIRRRA